MLFLGLLSACAAQSIPTTVYPPRCSLSSTVKTKFPRSIVLNVTDSKHDRCISAISPNIAGPAPILFDFHGAGGNRANYGGGMDAMGVSWADLAETYGFAVVGGEAIQWSGSPSPPSPSPVPDDCIACFTSKGCAPGPDCETCLSTNQRACTIPCGPEGVPFPSAISAVCQSSVSNSEQSVWNGGQWLIPEVQTDETGIKCDLLNDVDLIYIRNVVEALGAIDNGQRFDTSRIFFTGCSMGSAMTIWVAQCYHQLYPSTTTAFGTQSTGLKVKGDGLSLPPDNYQPSYTWGECPDCQYFPAPLVQTTGLKACIVDQTGDHDFYQSSLAMGPAWEAMGMRQNSSFTSGGHCQTGSYAWIANCLDDGTGRLLGSVRQQY